MEVTEQIKRFHEFLEDFYKTQILESVRKGQKFFVVDFDEIVKFDVTLGELILDDPEETIKAFEIAVEQFDLPSELKDQIRNFKIRIKNLPDTQNIMIRNIRTEHIGKFLYVEGVVRQKSDVRPQVTTARFECPSCGNVLSVIQLDSKFKEPNRCACGRKGVFRLLSKELVDAQGIVLEESSEDLEGGEQPKRINIFLKNDLVSPITDKKTNPGTKILVNGIVKEVPITLQGGMQSTRFDLMIDAIFVEPVLDDYSDIQITPEEEQEIREIGADPRLYERLVNSIAPSIFGHQKIKEALVFQLVGGERKTRDDSSVTRGDVHVLLVGDPGSGKSQLLKRISKVAPKGRFISGKGASGAGLTAAVVKDEFLKGWSLEAGALVLANRGLCCIDELDKMSTEDRSAMHEALEGQTVTISKANIQATLRAETTVLAAANPKFGRFDPYETIPKQIDLPPTLINRFDLIFAIRDMPNLEKDNEMVSFILNLHQNPKTEEGEIASPLLRKYLAYARLRIHPKLTEGAVEEIKEYYLKMRLSGSVGGEIKTIPISARQLEALVRLSEASAKTRLGEKVTRKDARRAIDLVDYCLKQFGLDTETGLVDIDRISTGISSSERTKIISIREIISELESTLGKNIPIEDILREAAAKGMQEDKVEEAIEKLKRSGDIFEPRRGFISKI
jgi:replicative DNA helicase Mcm